MQQAGITHLIDATHPYANTISLHARKACTALAIPLIQLYRSPWQATADDHWRSISNLLDLARVLPPYAQPFLTIGQSVAPLVASKTSTQHWWVRQIAPPESERSDVSYVLSQGPFSLDSEIDWMKQHQIDVLVSKNSGGAMSFNKILAARQLQLPVVMLSRPAKPEGDQVYHTVDTCSEAIQNLT